MSHVSPGTALGLTAALITWLSVSARANDPPDVSNVSIVVDPDAEEVTITYDLADADGDASDIFLRLSSDGGVHFLVRPEAVGGDVGFPVEAGDGRQIVWSYGLEETPPEDGGWVARVVADDRHPIDLQAVVDEVDDSRVLTDLEFLEGARHYSTGFPHIEATKSYMESAFTEAGLETRRHEFTYGVRAANIIGTIAGDVDEADVYIIDAHFDTVGSTPGADDNASGVAGMFEAMQVLSGYRFRNTIEFIGFDLEEAGIIGSDRYVAGGIPSYQDIRGVFNFEMIGYTCDVPGCDEFELLGDYIHAISVADSNPLRFAFDAAAAAFVPELNVRSIEGDINNPNLRRSDHVRFWDAGMRALFLSDGANFRNPHYHLASDLVSTLDMTFLTGIVKTTLAAVADLAGIHHAGSAESDPFVIGTTPTEDASWGDLKRAFR